MPGVPNVPTSAKTLSCSTSFLVAATALAAWNPSSSTSSLILRPFTPPWALIQLK